MSTALLAVVRCDCGGELRWVFTCRRCGVRWGHRDGVFGPLDRDPARQLAVGTEGLTPAESELLARVRQLPEELRSEVLSHVQALALSASNVS
jgi:hypothetical protein